jgi:hypothetical protein
MGTKSAHGAFKLDLAVPCALASSSSQASTIDIEMSDDDYYPTTTTVLRGQRFQI